MDPLGERLPGAAAGGDAEGVEAGADEEVRQLRRLAEDEVAVRREAFRAVDELLDAGGLQRRHSAERQLHELLEVRSEEHTSELQSLIRISYAVFCLKKK